MLTVLFGIFWRAKRRKRASRPQKRMPCCCAALTRVQRRGERLNICVFVVLRHQAFVCIGRDTVVAAALALPLGLKGTIGTAFHRLFRGGV